MTKEQIEQKILELKHDYIRIQGDMEKLESVGRSPAKAEKQLVQIEKELAILREALAKQS